MPSPSSNNGNTSPPTPEMGSDAAFSATPLITGTHAVRSDDGTPPVNSTFIQNQISIQRASSTAKSQASTLGRGISVRSNGSLKSTKSYDAGLSQSAILAVIGMSDDEDNEMRGRDQEGALSNLTSTMGKCSLSKSPSTSTVYSSRSLQSSKSVRSVHTVGAYPLGSLRVHSPSPTRGESFDGLLLGDVIIVSGIQNGCLLGYDTASLTINQNKASFDGIKEVPYGAHFVWAAAEKESTRTGVWLMSSKRGSTEIGDTHVLRWDQYEECLVWEVSKAEVRIQTDDVPKNFDKLHPYSVDRLHGGEDAGAVQSYTDPSIWPRLTGYIKGSFLQKVTGKEWNNWQFSSNDDYKNNSKQDDTLEIAPDYRRNEVLSFVFPKENRSFSLDTIGRERTEDAMDTSNYVMRTISTLCTFGDEDELVGEMQFCYITGMCLGNAACLEHWAHIVKHVFRAYKLSVDSPGLMEKFIRTLLAQLTYDERFDESILDSSGLREELRMMLTVFKARLNELLLSLNEELKPAHISVGKAFGELEAWLWKWNWDLRANYVRSGKVQLEDGEVIDAELKDFEAEDERGEYAPVVVELDEDGREKGLIQL
ncbi:AAR2 protein [Phlyctema vagabunda]|uniref:AAR2 protein n=1 Tax=Phlyctema vagabunda TaxID=108571 RepID=A0ABR4PR10_9HELO